MCFPHSSDVIKILLNFYLGTFPIYKLAYFYQNSMGNTKLCPTPLHYTNDVSSALDVKTNKINVRQLTLSLGLYLVSSPIILTLFIAFQFFRMFVILFKRISNWKSLSKDFLKNLAVSLS